MNETVFRDENKKWKPRNMQAAMIVRRASALLLHTPPPEPVKREPTLGERLEAESKIRLARIAAVELEIVERRERKALLRASRGKPKPTPVWKNMWIVKHAKRMAKSRGLPAPSQSELRSLRLSQYTTGKLI